VPLEPGPRAASRPDLGEARVDVDVGTPPRLRLDRVDLEMATDVDEQLGGLSPLDGVVEVQSDRGSATVAKKSRRATGRQRLDRRFERLAVD
jgi:hypothetical protein